MSFIWTQKRNSNKLDLLLLIHNQKMILSIRIEQNFDACKKARAVLKVVLVP